MGGKDKFSILERRAIMARVRSSNTTPERIVRSTLHKLGYRYRLHARELAGRPDLVFPSRRVALFIHGCFWHRHIGCRKGAAMPVARREYWTAKFARTVARDRANTFALEENGWTVIVVWECHLKNTEWVLNVQKILDATLLQAPHKFRVKMDRAL